MVRDRRQESILQIKEGPTHAKPQSYVRVCSLPGVKAPANWTSRSVELIVRLNQGSGVSQLLIIVILILIIVKVVLVIERLKRKANAL